MSLHTNLLRDPAFLINSQDLFHRKVFLQKFAQWTRFFNLTRYPLGYLLYNTIMIASYSRFFNLIDFTSQTEVHTERRLYEQNPRCETKCNFEQTNGTTQ